MENEKLTTDSPTEKSLVQNNYLSQKPTIAVLGDILSEISSNVKKQNGVGMMRYNLINQRREAFDGKERKWREWTDTDDSVLRAIIQGRYGLYNKEMLNDALNIAFKQNEVNPLLDLLESLEWDGKPRIENFLYDVMKAENTPYLHECSRLIFAGGIHRAYNPGCQFDDMIVLMGEQGNGKSTIVRWLNMDESYYREVKTISGTASIEALFGGWICEVAELLAITQAKEAEAVKAFITCRADRYRTPYEKHSVTLPRRCSFIGTTNKQLFLYDKTGNRRFYPVKCNLKPYELHDREEEIREYIRQAWAEAVFLFKSDKLLPYAQREFKQDILSAQENAMEDDWRVGAIQDYLERYKSDPDSTVSVIELWYKALNQEDRIKPTRKDSIEIAQIVLSLPDWERAEKPMNVALYGKQKVFIHRKKVETAVNW